MRNLIKRILNEERNLPQWYAEWVSLPREDRIKGIEDRKKKILKILPTMIKFFEEKYGDNLEEVLVHEKGVHYGNESHSTSYPLLIFYFSNADGKITHEIQNDMENFFNIDISYYGIPLDFEVYTKTWQRV